MELKIGDQVRLKRQQGEYLFEVIGELHLPDNHNYIEVVCLSGERIIGEAFRFPASDLVLDKVKCLTE